MFTITRRGQCMTAFAFGVALLLPACEKEADEAASQANRSTATPAPSTEAGAPATLAGADRSLGSQLAAKRQTLVAEAVSALEETNAALILLAGGKTNEAIEALARASGKLNVVVAADPQLSLAPVDVTLMTHDVIATPEAVNALRQRAEAALDDGRLQDARHLISDLASEQIISVTNLPLATYPAAIANAAALLHDGKAAEATAVLETALGTLVVEETIIALPLARAEVLLERARPLAENAQRSAGQNTELRRLLADARVQIGLARALGYATKNDLDALSDALTEIERKTEGQGTGKGLFDRLKEMFGAANRSANRRAGP